jgi:transaldolase
MRPNNLKTKIFLDGGDPQETREILNVLGFLDGQTTNPTLVAKNPQIQERLKAGEVFSEEGILNSYREIVTEISALIPQGSVSIEVPADANTSAEEMFALAKKMFTWIPNAHIKFPILPSGLEAAERCVAEGMRVNMTLCFSQEQGAAVYAATHGAKPGDVFLSPFVGRLDDRGENGMDLIQNILKMYAQEKSDGHVQVLAASVRTLDHFLQSLAIGADIVTVPFKVLKEWGGKGMILPDEGFVYDITALKSIPYQEISLTRDWRTYDISHELTDVGVKRFTEDWNALLGLTVKS